MFDEYPVTTRLVQELALDLKDQSGTLAEFALRLAPDRDRLIEAWCAGDTQAREWYEKSVRVLFDTLQSARNLPALEAYLNGVAAWSRGLASTGMNYGTASRQFTLFRRASLPFVLKAYAAGPELQMLFSALDDLERGLGTLTGAAYVDAAQRQLSQTVRLRMVGHLTRGIAHSLNNLLTRILGRAQLLELIIADEGARTELRDIEMAAHNAADTLRRVQEYATPHEDARAAVDVNAVVGDAVQLTRYRWRDYAEANGIVIDVIKDLGDIPPALGKRGELRDALVELVLNAVEAMPLGGLVTVRTERLGDQVIVSVSDLGEGIETSIRASVPTPFLTTKGAGHIGLGLATVAEIVKGHSGLLEIDSIPGQGTTVRVSLPIASTLPREEPVRRELPAYPLSILIVDDEIAIREITRKAFSLRGHRVATAESGFEAQRLFRESPPVDVVLCDLGMPGMNGFEVTRALKQVQPGTIVILMTGWAAELDAKQVRESGIYAAINKPFDIDQVLQLIAEALAST